MELCGEDCPGLKALSVLYIREFSSLKAPPHRETPKTRVLLSECFTASSF
jgi:hypothetical protein